MEEIENLKSRWDHFAFELFTPRNLTEKEWDGISAVRNIATNLGELKPFLQALPLLPATLKPEAEENYLRYAEGQGRTLVTTRMHRADPVLSKLNRAFTNDIANLHRAFFNVKRTDKFDYAIGFFAADSGGRLHQDFNDNAMPPIGVSYLVRVGTLPTEIITAERNALLTETEKKFRGFAEGASGHLALTARDYLRRNEILTNIPVNHLAVFATERVAGTWHCSSPVPPDGKHSALLHIRASLKYAGNYGF